MDFGDFPPLSGGRGGGGAGWTGEGGRGRAGAQPGGGGAGARGDGGERGRVRGRGRGRGRGGRGRGRGHGRGAGRAPNPNNNAGQSVTPPAQSTDRLVQRIEALALAVPPSPRANVPSAAEQPSQTQNNTTDNTALPWLLRLPSEILWDKLIFKYLPPRSALAVLPYLSRAFRTAFAPFTSKIPVTVQLFVCREWSSDYDLPARALGRVARGPDDQAGFHVFPCNRLSEPGWGRLSFNHEFETHKIPQDELEREGPATPPDLRTAAFNAAFPSLSRPGQPATVRISTRGRGYRSNWNGRTGEPLRPVSVGTHFACNLFWHQPGHGTSVPPFRKVANLRALVADSIQAWCSRPVVVVIRGMTFECGDDGHGLSVEHIARCVGPSKRLRIFLDNTGNAIDWDGSLVPGVNEFLARVMFVEQFDGMRLSRWTDLERVQLEVVNSYGEEMELLPELVRERAHAESTLAPVFESPRGGGRGRGRGRGGASSSPGRAIVPLKEFDLTLYNVQDYPQFTQLATALCNLRSLTVLRICAWHREEEHPTSEVTFDVADPECRVAYAAFHHIPTVLPALREFGDMLDAERLLDSVATPGAWSNLTTLGVQISGSNVGVSGAPYWKRLGQVLAVGAPGLERLRVGGLTIGTLSPNAFMGATAGSVWSRHLAGAFGEGLFGTRQGKTRMHGLRELVFGAERNVDLWRGVRDGGRVLKAAHGVDVKTEFVDGLMEREEVDLIHVREWTVETMEQLL